MDHDDVVGTEAAAKSSDSNKLTLLEEKLQQQKLDADETLQAFLQFAEGVRIITRHMQTVPEAPSQEEEHGDGKEEKSSAGDDQSNVPPPLLLQQLESMVANTCLHGTVFGTDLLRLWDAAHHVRDFARLVSEESSVSTKDLATAQEAATKALHRAERAEIAARNLHQQNKHLQKQVHLLTTERRLLIQEVKTLRHHAATARKMDMERLLQQHIVGALLVHEEQLKATMALAQQQKLEQRERRRLEVAQHGHDEEKKEDPDGDNDDDDLVEVVALEECEESLEQTPAAAEEIATPAEEASIEEDKDDGKHVLTSTTSTLGCAMQGKIQPESATNLSIESATASVSPPTSQAELIAIAKAKVDATRELEGGAFGILKRALGASSPRRNSFMERADSSTARLTTTSADSPRTLRAPAMPKDPEMIQLPTLEVETTDGKGVTKQETPSEPVTSEKKPEMPAIPINVGDIADKAKEQKELESTETKKGDENNDSVKPDQPTPKVAPSYAPVKLFPSFGFASPKPALPPGQSSQPENPQSSRSVNSNDLWLDGPVDQQQNVGSKVFNFLFYPEKMSQQRHHEMLRQQQLKKLQEEKQPQNGQDQEPAYQPREATPARRVNNNKQKPLLELSDPSEGKDNKDETSVDATAPTMAASTPGSTCASGSRARSTSNTADGKQSLELLQKQQIPPTFIPNCVSFADDNLSVQSNLPSPKFNPSSKRSIRIGASTDDEDEDMDGLDGQGKNTTPPAKDVELYQHLKVFRSLAIPTDDEIADYHRGEAVLLQHPASVESIRQHQAHEAHTTLHTSSTSAISEHSI
jgi:hypothetical protein